MSAARIVLYPGALIFELNSTYTDPVNTSADSRAGKARAALLRAAAEELAITGGLEVAAVSRRAGVSAGLPYRYFGSRSGLLIAIVDDFYHRLGAHASMRKYGESTWAQREQHRIADWVAAVYADPLAPVVLGGVIGDAEVAAAHHRHVSDLIKIGSRNIGMAQETGELPGGRDPELLAAATLGGTNTVLAVALARNPRPTARAVTDELWTVVHGIVGLTEGDNT